MAQRPLSHVHAKAQLAISAAQTSMQRLGVTDNESAHFTIQFTTLRDTNVPALATTAFYLVSRIHSIIVPSNDNNKRTKCL
ncbi:Trans-enoyl reductase lepG [Fusarium oxysporum f. sp. albedinis]|nr:Trans-enoyl reductase lepG [Fusarium oxysporum f. sp. albedinis]